LSQEVVDGPAEPVLPTVHNGFGIGFADSSVEFGRNLGYNVVGGVAVEECS